ncbi:MAG: hypothetical protein BV459_00590 [Thermoplasmata archaeon M11B2D]|nr:MAG: hypothetical protein BV459_00590 [Thermoplasmata archaeon M11B2D]
MQPQNNQKTFKQFRQQLFEGISPVLYHTTYAANAANILDKDKFVLSVAVNHPREEEIANSGKRVRLFYLSTSRSKLGSYQDTGGVTGVTFVLDGKKISNNFSGKSIDYFSGSGSGSGNIFDGELEDRIVSDKPEITHASKYITEVHLLLGENLVHSSGSVLPGVKPDLFILLKNLAKKRNIPFYMYTNRKHFLLQNKKEAYTGIDIDRYFNNKPEKTTFDTLFAPDKFSLISQYALAVYLMVKSKDRKELTKNINKLGSDDKDSVKRMVFPKTGHSSKTRERISSIMNVAIQNNSGARDIGREYVNEIVRYMERNKFRSATDLVDHLILKHGLSK